MIFYQGLISIFITTIMFILLNFLSKKSFYDREKSSPFECGFDPKNYARLPFSLHFFLLAIIFIIFDVELTLLFPSIIIMKFSNLINFSLTIINFIFILIFGLFHEMNQGSLNWAS
uniref:NADH dehydrogenase subunit 3 n=1 Tax=Scolytoplatypus wugongshanensis TaxID=2894162 RepID=UPI0023AA890A|nr:NADH dehydrogenase subunit 3 [Scolytoplatypus wugongshanensis]WCB99741.1 NADH dehydrogenase subunit 3 [Scolytoplatypus wugongshanensis]